jgi:hypothetical protein
MIFAIFSRSSYHGVHTTERKIPDEQSYVR